MRSRNDRVRESQSFDFRRVFFRFCFIAINDVFHSFDCEQSPQRAQSLHKVAKEEAEVSFDTKKQTFGNNFFVLSAYIHAGKQHGSLAIVCYLLRHLRKTNTKKICINNRILNFMPKMNILLLTRKSALFVSIDFAIIC